MTNLTQKFIDFIRSHSLVNPYDKILIGVSGGRDSMALLDLFRSIQNEFNLRIAAAHINHHLRGESANRDEKFVQDVCRRYGIPCYAIKGNAALISEENYLSLEAGARQLRFSILDELTQRSKSDVIALAHHADDQAETVFLHLMQGAGLRGLRGILPKRDYVIHPLLFATRDEINAYIRENEISYVNDESNTSTKMVRNRIRHEILPFLNQSLKINCAEGLNHSANYLAEVESFIQYHVKQACMDCVQIESSTEIILDIHRYLGYFSVIQSGLLIQIIENIKEGCQPAQRYEIDSARKLIHSNRSSANITIGQGIQIIRTPQSLVFRKRLKKPAVACINLFQKEAIQEYGILLNTLLTDIEQMGEIERKDKNIEYLDFDVIELPLIIRTFHPGDKFRPIGMKQYKKLHDFFIDQKVPNYKRNQIPILVDNEDRIVWICGHRLDDRFKITDQTQKVLKIETIPLS